MEVPTGGKVRERKLNLCDSGTDSRVWMIEEAPEAVGHFLCPSKGGIMNNTTRRGIKTRNITRVGVLSVMAFILMNIKMPLAFIAPAFMKLDISDVPVLLGAFTMGPIYGVIIAAIKNILNIIITGTDTGMVGELSNFIIASVYAITASVFYRRYRTFKGAILSLILGIVLMTTSAFISNYYFIFPLYAKIMPMEAIVAMGSKIFPKVTDLFTMMVYCIIPFNIIKGSITAVVTVLLYERVRPALKDS